MKKNIQDWTEADIESFVRNRLPESATVEFKACDALRAIPKRDWRKEFAKDVSAFANSGGGTLIYGIIENRETHEADTLDDGFYSNELNVETLEQIINSRIQRRIEGITIKAITLSGTRDGKFFYVLDIPESGSAPHMANFRFYRRYNFESVYMEEHEVRERYRRETYPGKDIVEAWRDEAINPLIHELENEALTLSQDIWTWSNSHRAFQSLNELANETEFSANKDDFISRHAAVRERLQGHDELLEKVNDAGKVLFDKISGSSFIKDIFSASTSEDALSALADANPYIFRKSNPAELLGEVFSHDRSVEERLHTFTEWIINGKSPANAEPIMAYWKANSERFRSLILYPPLLEYRTSAENARSKLIEFNNALVGTLKQIRKQLSERHNIRVEAPAHSFDYSELSWGPRVYR